jgi:hypothetical protein
MPLRTAECAAAAGIPLTNLEDHTQPDVTIDGAGGALGMNKVLHEQLEIKFGPLPKWAADRMA